MRDPQWSREVDPSECLPPLDGGPTTMQSADHRKEVRTVRRLMLLLAVGTFWLFLAAIPAFADGGPHVQSKNSGMTGLTADGCAGCHRAHTAQGGEALLVAPEEQLCQSCHGYTALGATTNVWNGVQYKMGATASDRDPSVILGALRNGGFYTATIGTNSAAHLAYGTTAALRFRPKVPVAAGLVGGAVTSAHLAVSGKTLPLTHTVWGNGATGSGAGATTATLDCTSCHNPHGNGSYRILAPVPTVSGSGNFVVPTTAALVTDAALPGANDTRNYTVIQTVSGTGAAGAATWTNTSLTASQVSASNVSGDYMHRYVPWNATATNTFTLDGPNGLSGSFNGQITAWCTQCHTRYMSTDYSANSGDPIFTYKHGVNADRGNSCVTCHVGHGTNAIMTGDYSSTAPYPGNAAPASASSRLLKVDNRGTCQMCHDPTGQSVPGNYYPAAPVPLVP